MTLHVDFIKYAAHPWHEIAAFPAWFQKGCTNVTAQYTPKSGYIEVKNRCETDGKEKIIIGKAFPAGPDLLKVQFFWPLKAPIKLNILILINTVTIKMSLWEAIQTISGFSHGSIHFLYQIIRDW